MAININNDLTSNTTTNSRQKAAAADKASSKSESTPAPISSASSSEKDNVELSPEAQLLKGLEIKIQQAPDVDTPKVDAIKQAIAEGSYSINVERITEKLLSSDQLLG